MPGGLFWLLEYPLSLTSRPNLLAYDPDLPSWCWRSGRWKVGEDHDPRTGRKAGRLTAPAVSGWPNRRWSDSRQPKAVTNRNPGTFFHPRSRQAGCAKTLDAQITHRLLATPATINSRCVCHQGTRGCLFRCLLWCCHSTGQSVCLSVSIIEEITPNWPNYTLTQFQIG